MTGKKSSKKSNPIRTLKKIDAFSFNNLEEQLRIKDTAIASSLFGIGIGDLEGNIAYVNNAALKMWGATDPSEVLGRSILEFAAYEQEALAVINTILEKGSWEGEIAGIRKDGSTMMVHLSANLVYNNRGEPICIMDSFIDITDRKKMEEELRVKDFAIASSLFGIGIGDLEGNITYVNRAAMKMWGADNPNELIGRNALEFAHSPEEGLAVLTAVIETGSWEGEIAGIRKDGTPIITIFSANLVYNNAEEPICIMVSLIDITDRKKMEEDLRVKEFAIASSLFGIGIADLTGNITYANDAALEMWGSEDISDLIGRSALDFAYSQEEALAVLNAIIEKGSWEGEIAARRKDGTVRMTYLSANLVYNDRGEPICIMDSLIDITERKKMEEDLRVKDFAIASTINAIVIGDLEGNITYVNNAFLSLWGDDNPSNVLGKSAISFAHDQDQARQILESIFEKGHWFGEIQGVRKDGMILTVQLSANVVTNADQQPICLMCSFVDISDRKRVEERLARANEELEERVTERTRELVESNAHLVREIEERKQVEASLRQKEEELSQKSQNLEETNTALKILLKQREQDKEELEEKVLANVKELVLPYIGKIKNTPLNHGQKTYIDILESNVMDIVSPYLKKLSSHYQNFTPLQIQVADMVKSGKTTKEISELLNISDRAVEFHRNNIRSKLGIKNRKINLRSYLLSLS